MKKILSILFFINSALCNDFLLKNGDSVSILLVSYQQSAETSRFQLSYEMVDLSSNRPINLYSKTENFTSNQSFEIGKERASADSCISSQQTYCDEKSKNAKTFSFKIYGYTITKKITDFEKIFIANPFIQIFCNKTLLASFPFKTTSTLTVQLQCAPNINREQAKLIRNMHIEAKLNNKCTSIQHILDDIETKLNNNPESANLIQLRSKMEDVIKILKDQLKIFQNSQLANNSDDEDDLDRIAASFQELHAAINQTTTFTQEDGDEFDLRTSQPNRNAQPAQAQAQAQA